MSVASSVRRAPSTHRDSQVRDVQGVPEGGAQPSGRLRPRAPGNPLARIGRPAPCSSWARNSADERRHGVEVAVDLRQHRRRRSGPTRRSASRAVRSRGNRDRWSTAQLGRVRSRRRRPATVPGAGDDEGGVVGEVPVDGEAGDSRPRRRSRTRWWRPGRRVSCSRIVASVIRRRVCSTLSCRARIVYDAGFSLNGLCPPNLKDSSQ